MGLNGCCTVDGWFLKRNLRVFDLSNVVTASRVAGLLDIWLGTNFRPSVSILFCAGVRVFVDRFVM